MSEIKIKMCKDCKWRGRNWFVSAINQYCHHPTVVKIERYNNPGDNGKAFANLARVFGPCYKEGKYWEDK